MKHIPALAYLERVGGINERFQPAMRRIAKRLPASKKERFWHEVVKAAWVGLRSVEVPDVVRSRPRK